MSVIATAKVLIKPFRRDKPMSTPLKPCLILDLLRKIEQLNNTLHDETCRRVEAEAQKEKAQRDLRELNYEFNKMLVERHFAKDQ